MKKVITHRDGTISYWSVYRQVRVVRARGIEDVELAAMSASDRARVITHLHLDDIYCHGCGDTIAAATAHWHNGDGYCDCCDA